jgi:Cof subfamily protein (haloacid dehalogenase superfamily)
MSPPRFVRAAWSTTRRAVAKIQKLIACDLDGTLLDSHSLIPQRAVDGIRAALGPEVEFTFCSGRGEGSMKPFVEQLGIIHVPMITETGAAIQDPRDWHVIAEWDLSYRAVETVLNTLEHSHYDFNFFLSSGLDFVVLKNSAAPFFMEGTVFGELNSLFRDVRTWHDLALEGYRKIAIRCHAEEMDALEWDLEHVLGRTANVLRSDVNCLDVMGAGVTKGTALVTLAHMLGVDMKNVMAIGDNETDASMFDTVGVPVTTANGDQSVKKLAHYIVPSNDECGVVTAVERFVTGEYHA